MGVTRWEGELEIGREREESKRTPMFLAWVTVWVAIPFTERGYTRGKRRL